ncbi:hypothetical protein B0A49_02614 [Cryomyces minteri]|uniref:PNPLA domain-containing protein n=1 Tax=Cryomyces minteri TaxID=331657 RepID=A0A4U0XS32_9PEZI|nr:hypothetical protein B0A49_02614 [Cryomyces minteri]
MASGLGAVIPHEKTDFAVAQKIEGILSAPMSDEAQAKLHKDDENTSWFGITRENSDTLMFKDYGRYPELMASTQLGRSWSSISQHMSSQGPTRDTRYPSLVSFVGQTGAGKSTLIKLIIDVNTPEEQEFATPVVGTVGQDVPTSDGVHLYLDPPTSSSETPILYADCEGLDGGEREPHSQSLSNVDSSLWDPEIATQRLVQSLSDTVYKNPTFTKYARFWKKRDRPIVTIEELILSYYSSLNWTPKPHPATGWEVVRKNQRKAALRMLLDAEDLQPYLQYAFDHFADHLDTPFDFVQASFSNSPIPLDFGGNILKLALNMMELWRNQADGSTIFQELSYMVASCNAAELFPQYLEHLDAALENFCDRHWPCEYVKPGGGERCVNVRSGHGSKGHQLRNGKVISVGDYVSRFAFETRIEEFRTNVYFRLEELLEILRDRIQEPGTVEETAAAEIHRDDVMAYFYNHAGRGRGGIRGIVELAVLQQIERAMGGKLAVQYFFDLVVGTSTGGLIALGLATQSWSVEDCTTHFEELCEKAFSRRAGSNFPFFGRLVDNYNHSRYETRPLEEALTTAFSPDVYLFGGRRINQSPGPDLKVAVTATSATGSGVVFANYNRLFINFGKVPYIFQRPEEISAELKIWEAARATSAAPKTFKPLHHEPSKQVYMDGAIYHNHPIHIADRERKLLWRGLQDEYPDMIVSIGTSFNPQSRRVQPEKMQVPRYGVVSHVKSLIKIAQDHIASSLDSEKTWDEYLSTLAPPLTHRQRFIRISPELRKDPPRIDDYQYIAVYRGTARRSVSLELGSLRTKAEKFPIAARVVDDMIRRFQFTPQKIRVKSFNPLATTEISLCFDDTEWFPISGFPRTVLRDDSTQTKLRLTSTASPGRWAGRSGSQQQRRKNWAPPDPNQIQRVATVRSYGSAAHVLGAASADEMKKSAEYLTNGPSPSELDGKEIIHELPAIVPGSGPEPLSELFVGESQPPLEREARTGAEPPPYEDQRQGGQASDAHADVERIRTYMEGFKGFLRMPPSARRSTNPQNNR